MAKKPSSKRAPHLPSETSLKEVSQLIDQGAIDQAETQLAPLWERFPRHAGVLSLQGRIHHHRERREEAMECYRQSLATNPGQIGTQVNLAACLCRNGQANEAMELIEKVLAKKPDYTHAVAVKGDIHRERHELDEAVVCYRRAQALDPGNWNYHQALSHLTRFKEGDSAFSVLEKRLKEPTLSEREKANLHATLGKAHLDTGADDQAFFHFEHANRLMDESLPPIRSELERRLGFTRRTFTRPLFDRLSPYGLQDVPQIIVAGMSRSGKSLVESLFRNVQDVTLAGEELVLTQYAKELGNPYQNKLISYLSHLTPEKIREDAAGYRERLNPEKSIKVTTVPGDLWYLGLLGIWAPKVPIIFCVRGLLDLGVTGYFHQYQVPEGFRYSYDLRHLGRQIACSEKVMDHWLQVLPNPVYLVEYEQMVARPEEVMGNLLADLGLKREQASDDLAARNAVLLDEISPIVSSDAPMPVTDRFLGIGERFRAHLDPLIEGYREIAEAFPRYDDPAPFAQYPLPEELYEITSEQPLSETTEFDWSLPGSVTVIDNGSELLQRKQPEELLDTGAFGLVAFDPFGVVTPKESHLAGGNLQHIPNAVLGDGKPATLYACLNADYSATLKPLAGQQLPERHQQPATVLTTLPIPTIALDSIQGLTNLDWLVLDGRHDSMTILEHGTNALTDTLIVQVDISFQPIYERQPNLAEISHWASRHGFQFLRLIGMRHTQTMPTRSDLVTQPKPSMLEEAKALFIPSRERLEQLGDAQRLKLAFLLDTIYQIHDLAYDQLHRIGETLAERYLAARGFFDLPKTELPESERQKLIDSVTQVRFKAGTMKRLLDQLPKSARLNSLYAFAMAYSGQGEGAVDPMGKALNIAPRDLRLRLDAVELLLMSGQWWEACRYSGELFAQKPDHPEVQRLHLQALLTQPKMADIELDEARTLCEGLLTAAPEDHRYLSLKGTLLVHQGRYEEAQRYHALALTSLGDIEGADRAQLLMAKADGLYQAGLVDDSCNTLWDACCARPYSCYTVRAYQTLAYRLPKSHAAELQSVAVIHQRTQQIWAGYKGEKLKNSFGDFGLPYQGFEPLKLPGTRPAMHRLGIYELEKDLPDNARALDIGCNHGFLLIGLANRLSYGEGFDISQACVDVGNAVAEHLGLSHIQLSSKPFEEFVCNEPFDLIIACAVHYWIGIPLPEFGAKLFSYCKPGGIVLLESQGVRKTDETEVNFHANATAIASVGFEVIRKGSLCDDNINYREFWVLRKVG